MNASRLVLVAMVAFLGGCSSCRSGEESSTGGSGGAAAKATPPAATAPGKIQVAPPQPANAVRPPNVPAAGAPPAAQGGAEAAPPGAPQVGGGTPPERDDCVVVADVNPDFGPPPLAVAFTAEADCGQGATYKWDFGDGSPPSTEPNPTHTYTKDGDYTASVTVTGTNGSNASDEIDIFVEED
jgi:PKD repeat protein